jgi:alcohol dehydrogenase class IV
MRFGRGILAQALPQALARCGMPIAVARGGTGFPADTVYDVLRRAGIATVELPPQTREPEPADVDAAVTIAREAGAAAVLAVGGGSVLDLGKAVAALVPQDPPAPVRDFLEGVGTGRTLTRDPLPFIAIPTTAGTGSEATKNAVISSAGEGFKKSLRDPRMVAATVLLDPELTTSLPPVLTAHTGLDAVTQLIEAYTSRYAQPITDTLALRGLAYARSLPDAYADGTNLAAREMMLLAAYLSGVCLANAGLCAAHGIAAALGSLANVPHGLACALALPWVMAINAPAVGERYAHVAEALTGDPFVDADIGGDVAVRHIWELLRRMRIPRVTEMRACAAIFSDAHLPALAAACHGNSLRGNPRTLNDDDLIRLLHAMRDAESPLALLA